MYKPILKTIIPKKDLYFAMKKENCIKDLFSKKLGRKVDKDYNIKTKINYNFNSRHPNLLKNISAFPKCNSNSDIYNSNIRLDNTTKNSSTRNKPAFPHVNKGERLENNKQMRIFQFSTTFRKFNNKNNNKDLKILILENINRNKLEENNKKEINNEHLPVIKENIINKIEKKKNKIFIKSFFENLIDISNIYDSFEKYIVHINKFNEEYFTLFEIDSFNSNNHINSKFLNIYKYSCILIICLIFLSKDENLYKENIIKMKELLQQYIYISIYSMDYKILDSAKINFFIDKIELIEKLKEKNILDKLNEIINLLFLEKMNEYKKIRKCIKQLANNINLLNPKQILSIVNKSILYCHNCKYLNKNKSNDNNKIENRFNECDIDNKTPFIKEKSNKNFCFVLNLNETIIHNMNLPFGDYFFVRPGLFDLLEKVHNFFEIIIFASEDKNVVDDIINKIDNKKFIDYILYKKHCIYEEGKAIKKLELIGRDLKKIIYVDNSEISIKYNIKNLYKISSWYNNVFDEELSKLKEKLINIYNSGKNEDDIISKLYNV